MKSAKIAVPEKRRPTVLLQNKALGITNYRVKEIFKMIIIL